MTSTIKLTHECIKYNGEAGNMPNCMFERLRILSKGGLNE